MGRRKTTNIVEGGTVQRNRTLRFEDVYADFRRRHPNLAKQVIHFVPHDYLKIRVYLDDGKIIIYDYWNHKGIISHANWRRDQIHLGGLSTHEI